MMTTQTAMASPIVDICTDPADLAQKAAQFIAQAAHDAIAQRGRFTLVLTGGSTPENTYILLADPQRPVPIQWSNTYLFLGDERFVDTADPRSNFGMIQRSLLSRISISPSHVFPMPLQMRSAAQAAAEYDKQLCEFFSTSDRTTAPQFDLILLGLGEDGHTASLFPRAHALDVGDVWVTWSPPGTLPPQVDRITLTFPVINAARQVAFLVSGKKKAIVVRDILEGWASREDRPAAGVKPLQGTVRWFIDKDAAQLLTEKS
jgi:6-phosphogluconolactonase